MRLDRALAARGLARSRTHAQSLIADGRVRVNGVVVSRSSLEVDDAATVSLDAPDPYVSRGARKLAGALDRFGPAGLSVAGRRCLDVGASTGGFTQVLLERGAAGVLAVDVGHGQLAPSVAADPRVTALEGANIRDLTPSANDRVDVVVADLSFISLTLVAASIADWLVADGDALLLVKPQFEVGVEALPSGKRARAGVVRDRAARKAAVRSVADAMADAGLGVVDVARSAVSGARGNVEFFIWGRKTWQAEGGALDAAGVRRAIEREVDAGP